jgi:hypothetical protein
LVGTGLGILSFFEVRAVLAIAGLCVAIIVGAMRWLWTKAAGRPPSVEFELRYLVAGQSVADGDQAGLSYEVVNRSDPPVSLVQLSTGVLDSVAAHEVEVELGSAATLAPTERLTVVAKYTEIPERLRDLSFVSEGGSLLCWVRFTDAEEHRWKAIGAPGSRKIRYRIDP